MRFMLLLLLTLPACKDAAQGTDVAVVAGKRLGALVLGQKPIANADGHRKRANDNTVHYWSALGIEAHIDPSGVVAKAVAHGAQSDPFFSAGFAGKTQEGLGTGSSRAAIETALGKAKTEEPRTSAFGPQRTRMSYNGIAFDIDTKTNTVLSISVIPAAPP